MRDGGTRAGMLIPHAPSLIPLTRSRTERPARARSRRAVVAGSSAWRGRRGGAERTPRARRSATASRWRRAILPTKRGQNGATVAEVPQQVPEATEVHHVLGQPAAAVEADRDAERCAVAEAGRLAEEAERLDEVGAVDERVSAEDARGERPEPARREAADEPLGEHGETFLQRPRSPPARGGAARSAARRRSRTSARACRPHARAGPRRAPPAPARGRRRGGTRARPSGSR